VFTLPQQIGRLALQNPRQIYTILFQAASDEVVLVGWTKKRHSLDRAAG
jgi:hypothetical protein